MDSFIAFDEFCEDRSPEDRVFKPYAEVIAILPGFLPGGAQFDGANQNFATGRRQPRLIAMTRSVKHEFSATAVIGATGKSSTESGLTVVEAYGTLASRPAGVSLRVIDPGYGTAPGNRR